MKRLLSICIVCFSLISSNPASAGDGFEGIWQVTTDLAEIFGFHTKDTSIVGITLNASTTEAGYIIGTFIGNTATFTQAHGGSQFGATAQLLSPTSLSLTITLCVPLPGFVCALPQGTILQMNKVF